MEFSGYDSESRLLLLGIITGCSTGKQAGRKYIKRLVDIIKNQ